jgi:phosphonate transport system substrate-binding protein
VRLTAVAASTLLALLTSACLHEQRESPSVLRVGVLPDESEVVLRQRYEPLLRYLSEATGLSLELVIPRDYGQLLELFGQEKVDLAYFGGFTFIRAREQFGAVPLVMRDTDVHFRSYFLARSDDPAKTIADFRGKRLAFGSEFSTSGHLMPRHFLRDMGISAETYFGEVRFSGAHDQTAVWIRDGISDLGAANSAIIKNMFADGRLDADQVRIVWETPPYPDYVWAARSELDEAVRERILGAFLQLSPNHEAQAKILSGVNAGGFLPARAGDFDELRGVALALDML